MEILDSALAREINLITTGPPTGVSNYFRAEFHANGQNIAAMKVLSIDTIRDYESNFTDEVIVQLVVGAGTYAYRIYPYLEALDITIYESPLLETSGGEDTDRRPVTKRYTATILNPQSIQLGGKGMTVPDEFSLDLKDMLTLNFQLVDKVVEQARMRSVGGVYRKTTVEDVVKTILTNETAKIEIQNAEDKPLGVEFVPATNTKTREHIVIPHGVRLTDLPQHVHMNCGGIYGTGLAYYYQGRYWYVFPPYDSSRFDQSTKKLTIIRMPSNRLPGLERTFRHDGNNIVILAGGDTQVKNPSDELMLNKGNGVRFADADSFMGGFVQTSGNKALASRGGVNNEFVTVQRPNGNNNVLSSDKRISANPLAEYSKLAAREGSLIGLTWENSNPDLITPGMSVKVMYLEGENIKETYGLVIKTHHYTQTRGKGITSTRHFTTTTLTIFAKRDA